MRYEELNLSEEDLRKKNIIEGSTEVKCVICGNPTRYIDYCTESHICSEECMFLQNRQLTRSDMLMGDLWKSYIEEAAVNAVTSDANERVLAEELPLCAIEKEDYLFKFSKLDMQVSFAEDNLISVTLNIPNNPAPARTYKTTPKLLWEEMCQCMKHWGVVKGLIHAEEYLQHHNQNYKECFKSLYDIED